MLGVLVRLIGAYLVWQSGVLTQFGIPAPGATAGTQTGPPVQVVSPSSAVGASLQTGTAAANGVAAGLNLVPVAGPAISVAFKLLSSTLLAASAARAKAATSENAAVAPGIPGWDAAVG